jgi:hypothetical protein
MALWQYYGIMAILWHYGIADFQNRNAITITDMAMP